MLTAIGVSLALGAVAGGLLGWKMGRGYEQVRAPKRPKRRPRKK